LVEKNLEEKWSGNKLIMVSACIEISNYKIGMSMVLSEHRIAARSPKSVKLCEETSTFTIDCQICASSLCKGVSHYSSKSLAKQQSTNCFRAPLKAILLKF